MSLGLAGALLVALVGPAGLVGAPSALAAPATEAPPGTTVITVEIAELPASPAPTGIPAPGATPPGAMPATGADPGRALGIGLGALAAGSLLAAATRTRHARRRGPAHATVAE